MPVEKQVIIIYAATKKYLIDIKIEDILRFEAELFDFIDTRYPEIPEAIREKKVMDDDTEQALIKAIEECKSSSVRRLDISRRQVVKWLRCET